jgi:hypothetical protein
VAKDKKADAADPAANPNSSTDDTGTSPSADSPAEGRKPVGKVVELAKATRDGKTVRVLQDDKHVWKEAR